MTSLKKRHLSFLSTTIFIISATLVFFTGCEKENALSPEIQLNENKGLVILPLGEPSTSFNKIISSSEYINANTGGIITLEYKKGDIEIEMSVEILPNSINKDTLIHLQIDDDYFLGELGADFYPPGIVFNEPAIFNIYIEMEDIDTSTINTNSLDIYFDRNGQWELMSREALNIEVDGDEITIEVVNARFSHFSRYILAWPDYQPTPPPDIPVPTEP